MAAAAHPLGATSPPDRRAVAVDVLLLSLLVFVVYFARIGDLPPLGEEGRRARGAVNMIESGDWVVMRQGGVVFADRPPMTQWLIAVAGLARGQVDIVAARLPSVVAVLATTLLLYLYCARFDSRLAATTAAAAYATFAQVMQIGRLGESEAAFGFFVAASLLLWHLAFASGWRPVSAWLLGYSLAALGALSKGLQAPVYFVGTTVVFLLLRGNRRWMLGWGQWIGLTAFALAIAAWQVPYSLATGAQASIDNWVAVAGARIGLGGLLGHLAGYPLETIGSLLPWSLALLALADRGIRQGLLRDRPHLAFILTALAVTYPTVWLAAGAKTRYYLPLYPCVAVLVGALVARMSAAPPGSFAARLWRFALRAAAVAAVGAVVALGLAHLVDSEPAVAMRQTAFWSGLVILAAAATVAAIRRARSGVSTGAARRAVLATAALLGIVHTTFWLDSLASQREDPRPLVAALRAQIPAPETLVSLGPVDTRFAFAYRHLIREVPWPATLAEVPPDLDYFCFDVRLTDTPESRYAERGMHDAWTTPGTLPFAWEEIGRVAITPEAQGLRNVTVVIGRVRRGADGLPVGR